MNFDFGINRSITGAPKFARGHFITSRLAMRVAARRRVMVALNHHSPSLSLSHHPRKPSSEKKTQRVELKVPKNKETLPDSPINRGYLIYYLIPKLCPFINPIIYLSHPGTEELLPQERSIYLLAPTIPVILGWQLL